MLTIRRAQLAALQRADDDRFERRLIEHLRAEHPALAQLPDELFGAMTRNGITRAQGHGLRSERDLARFVALMIAVAPNFDEQPGLRAWLDDPRLPPEQRIDAMLAGSNDAMWDDARAASDVRAWSV